MQMIKTNVLLLCTSFVMLTIAGSMMMRHKASTPSKDMVLLEVRTIKMADGWGYDILADNKVYVHQDAIPAIASPKRFVTEAEALLTGNAVVEKLKNGKLPSLTLQELQKLKIHY